MENIKEMLAALEETKSKFLAESKSQTDAAVAKAIEDINANIATIKQLPDGVDLVKMQSDLEATIKGFNEYQSANKNKIDLNQHTPKSLSQAIYDAANEPEVKSQIEAMIKSGGKQTAPLVLNLKGFSLKDAVTIGMSNTIEAVGSASHYTLTSDTGIVSTIRKRILTYLSNVSVGALNVDKPYAMWIEELDEQGTPIFIGEGDDKTALSVRYEEREKKAQKIAVHGKVTTEFLRYLSKLVSYVQNNLMKRMDIVTENQLFNGDGNGDNLSGLLGYATAFDGGAGLVGDGLAGTVADANDYDVIRAVALQVRNSYGIPSAIFVKEDVLAAMDVAKGEDGHYVMPPFKTADGSVIGGLRLIPTTALYTTDFDFVGGDLSVANVEFLQNATIQIGLDGNDFTKNKKTILLEQELVQFVSANDTKVIVKGTFAAGRALLEATS